MRPRSFSLGELTWPDVKDFLKEHNTAIIPVGACEQHGPHIPLDTDAFFAYYAAIKAAEKSGSALVVPPVNYGFSEHHMDFPGTVTLTLHTLEELVYEIASSLVRHGFRKILIICGHGGNGNDPALKAAIHRIKNETGALMVLDSFGLLPEFAEKYLEAPPPDIHGGEATTSATLAIREELVPKDRIKKPTLTLPKWKYIKVPGEKGPHVYWSWRTKDLTDTGVIGDPTKATKEKGEKFWELYIAKLADLLAELDKIEI